MSDGYIRHIDGLRATAILLVLISHFTPSLARWTGIGDAGVILFFVISGYLITHNLLRARSASAGQALRAFYMRRVLRIFPVYFLALALALSAGIVESAWLPWLLTFTSNWRMAWMNNGMGPMSPYWSLAVEEQFYLVWPWLMLLTPWKAVPRIILGAIAIGILVRGIGWYLNWPFMFMYASTPSAFDALGLGALVAYFETSGNRIALQRVSFLNGVAMMLVIAAYLARGIWPQNRMIYQAFEILVATAATAVIGTLAGRLQSSRLSILTNPAVVYIGLISYGIYAYHMVFYQIVARLFGTAALTTGGRVGRLGVEAVLILAFAALSYRFMETPINRLKRYFPYSGGASKIKDTVLDKTTT
jgi:peptidoglycan/LPS O-acetylase OafA/YrhL